MATINRASPDAAVVCVAPALRSEGVVAASENELIARLRSGDEAAFVDLVAHFQPRMIRLARSFVPSDAVAEEVVQETWVAVLRGLGRFEGRSTLSTWLFAILVNRAKSAGVRENRDPVIDPDDLADQPGRFTAAGAWSEPPEPWSDRVDDQVVAAQLASKARRHLADLPDLQRQVILLRDVEGLTSAEVCSVLGISEGNLRVLLHRGRTRVRNALNAEVTGS